MDHEKFMSNSPGPNGINNADTYFPKEGARDQYIGPFFFLFLSTFFSLSQAHGRSYSEGERRRREDIMPVMPLS